YCTREMTDPKGGFYSTQDADSEGEEGKFFVWTPEEVATVVGEDARVVCDYYDVTRGGNFEHGRSILHRELDEDVVAARHDLKTPEVREIVARSRPLLLAEREKRVRPGRDEKVLVSWNGIMAAAFARGALSLRRPDYLETARRNVAFLLTDLVREGRLHHSWKSGTASGLGFVDDYAALIWALLHLYQADFDPSHVARAEELARVAVERFWDPEDATFYLSDPDQGDLLLRPRELEDNATPSGNSLMLLNLLWLGRLTGRGEYAEKADQGLRRMAALTAELPAAFGLLLRALDFHLGPPAEIVLTGDDVEGFLERLAPRFLPRTVLARTGPDWPICAGKGPVDGRSAAYACRDYACQAPVTDPACL
ncbi:MAG: thioredoxin domain-containing protein, partial [Candidatus Eremiobacterota bacterium]